MAGHRALENTTNEIRGVKVNKEALKCHKIIYRESSTLHDIIHSLDAITRGNMDSGLHAQPEDM